ncbi:HIT family protein [Zavarzinia sp. CC-PAN008]|uniref:HIT family protein n=1 Tax=Zavarzinia sp. CC-PAN008 TaxID=3243332 RepID=UPI003F7460CC
MQRVAYDRNNIFGKIIRGEAPSVVVYQDDDVLSFMDVFPQAPGHTLVIAKRSQAITLLEIEPELLQKLIAATQRIAQAVDRALNPDGIMLMQLSGAAAGMTVGHLHFHIIPRWDGKAIKGHAHGQMADLAELKDQAARIAAQL